jgi:hypothetical protein
MTGTSARSRRSSTAKQDQSDAMLPTQGLNTTRTLTGHHHSSTAPHQHEPRLRHSDAHNHQPRLRAGANPLSGSLPAYRHHTPATRDRRAERACLLLQSSTAVVLCTSPRGRGQHRLSRALLGRRCQIHPLRSPTTSPRQRSRRSATGVATSRKMLRKVTTSLSRARTRSPTAYPATNEADGARRRTLDPRTPQRHAQRVGNAHRHHPGEPHGCADGSLRWQHGRSSNF